MEAFLSSVMVVTLGEMGDKTQLLALALASKFRKPWTLMLGIFIATLLNHALAAGSGALLSRFLTPTVMGWMLVASFFAFALWTLKPDELDDTAAEGRWGPLVSTIVLFFLAEMGDKTQLATIALGAKYAETLQVVVGTTLGMMLANALAVVIGDQLGERLPMRLIRYVTAALFAVLGVVTLIGLLSPGLVPSLLK